MKNLSIIALIILGLVVTGCSQIDATQEQSAVLKSTVKEEITIEDKAEVREIMHVAFVEKDIDEALENSFKDLKTLRKIKDTLQADSLDETKEIIVSKYEDSPISEKRDKFLDRYRGDTIIISEENHRISATIDIDINGDTKTSKFMFIQNEKGQWYDMEELLVLAKELKIDLEQ